MVRGTVFPIREQIVRQAKTQIILRNHVGWSVLAVHIKTFRSLPISRESCKDSYQSARMQKLILVFAWRTCNFVGNAAPRLKYKHKHTKCCVLDTRKFPWLTSSAI